MCQAFFFISTFSLDVGQKVEEFFFSLFFILVIHCLCPEVDFSKKKKHLFVFVELLVSIHQINLAKKHCSLLLFSSFKRLPCLSERHLGRHLNYNVYSYHNCFCWIAIDGAHLIDNNKLILKKLNTTLNPLIFILISSYTLLSFKWALIFGEPLNRCLMRLLSA